MAQIYPTQPPLRTGEEQKKILSLNLGRDVERSNDRVGRNLGQVNDSELIGTVTLISYFRKCQKRITGFTITAGYSGCWVVSLSAVLSESFSVNRLR